MKLLAASTAALLAAKVSGQPWAMNGVGGPVPDARHQYSGGMADMILDAGSPASTIRRRLEATTRGDYAPYYPGYTSPVYLTSQQQRRLDAAAVPDGDPYFQGIDVPAFGQPQNHHQQKPANAPNLGPLSSLAAMRDRCCALCPAGGIGCLARCSKECGNLDECGTAGRGAYAAVCQRGCFKFPLIVPSERAFQPSTTCEEICVKTVAEMCRTSNNCELDYGCVIDQCEAAAREMCATDRWRDFLRRSD